MAGMTIAASEIGISPAFSRLLEAEPLARLCGLDVGTGRGRLALALAPRCRRVVGIDVDARAIVEARRQAGRLGLANVEFVVADAEAIEYTTFAPDLVVAHLCMSDAIAERAARALGPGRAFIFVAFHADQWRETGRPSRFAYDEGQIRALLEGLGFAIDHLEVEREVRTFGSVEEALAAVVAFEDRWRQDGRWFGYLRYLEDGGRQLTRSHLVVKACRR
jgi:SAM-dependent methyltransferase